MSLVNQTLFAFADFSKPFFGRNSSFSLRFIHGFLPFFSRRDFRFGRVASLKARYSFAFSKYRIANAELAGIVVETELFLKGRFSHDLKASENSSSALAGQNVRDLRYKRSFTDRNQIGKYHF